jgi:transposase
MDPTQASLRVMATVETHVCPGETSDESGYDVIIDQSGTRIGKQKISKQGSPHIRAAMFMPASTVVRMKPELLISYYNRLLLRHGIKMKAHVALQKKLLTYMCTLSTKQQYYDPSRFVKFQDITETKVAPPYSHREATVDTSLAFANNVL